MRDSLRLVQEIRRDGSTTYVYSDTDSYVPLARIDTPDRAREYTRIYWYHTRPDGTPEQLSDSNGEEVWRIVNDAWGRVDTAWGEINSAAVREDNLRMQGQYLDRETGLHYNLFRYYDADSMHFISPDPIGIAGGLNLYQYAPNPLNWIDPLGLSKCNNNQANAYSTAYEMKLAKSSYPGVSRGRHFQEANESLLKAMESDKAFAKNMKELGINLERTPTGLAPRKPPEGWTWHHELEEGSMRLVPRSQHTPGSEYWKVLHPDGYGGYAAWGK